MTGYDLTRQWWDFVHSSEHKIKPEHHALYFYAMELCNRLGWKKRFGMPTSMTMEAIGIRSYKTYIKVFKDLCEWGMFELLEKSSNQHSANVIALAIFTEADTKASPKQTPKQVQSRASIIKQETNKTEKQQNGRREDVFEIPTLEQCIAYASENGFMDGMAYEFFEKYSNLQWKKKMGGEPVASWKLTMQTWMKRDFNAKWKKPAQQTTTRRVLSEDFDPLNP